VDTTVVVFTSAVGVQLADYLGIRHLRQLGPGTREFTLLARLLRREKHHSILLAVKILIGVAVGALYFALLSMAENQSLWEVYPYLRDGLLGSSLVGVLLTCGAHFLLATVSAGVPRASEGPPRKDWQRAVVLHAFFLALFIGFVLFALIQSLLLLAAAAYVGLVLLFNRAPDKPEEGKERDKKHPSVPASAKLLLAVCIITITAVLSPTVLASEKTWLSADYSSSLAVPDPFEGRVFGRGVHVANPVDLASDLDPSVLNWYAGEGTLSGFNVDPRGGMVNVTVWNQTSLAFSAATSQFYFAYASLPSCTRVGTSASSYQGDVEAANLSSLLRAGRSMGVNVTFDATQGSLLTGSFSFSSAGPRSTVYLACSHVAFYVGGLERWFNESVIIQLHEFGIVEMSMYLSYGSSISLYGPASIAFRQASSRVHVEESSEVSRGGVDSQVGGDLAVLEATLLTYRWSSTDFSYRGPSVPFPVHLEAEGAKLISTGGEFPGPVLPATSETWLVEPESTRLTVFATIWAIGLTLVFRIVAIPGKSSGEDASGKDRASHAVEPKIIALLLGMLLVGSTASGLLDGRPVGYYYARHPVNLHIWYEEGVPEPIVRGSIPLFLFQAEKLVGFHPSKIVYHAMPDDGRDEYERGDPRDWAPPGPRAHDTFLMGQGFPESFHIIFRSGKGLGFGGVSDFGAVIFIPVQLPTNPLWILYVLWHEFGHALGLLHNRCSLVMSDAPIRPPLLPSPISVSASYPYRGVDLFGQARNSTVQGFPDWGTDVGQLSMTSTALVWRWTLFLDSVSGSIREVDYMYYPSRGGEYVQIDFVPADILQWAFSEGEQAFILESVSGHSSALVVPEGQC
jgi:hypothetical protein